MNCWTAIVLKIPNKMHQFAPSVPVVRSSPRCASLKSIPELSGLAPAKRKSIWDKYAIKACLRWPVLLALVFLLAFTALGVELRFFLKEEFPQVNSGYVDYPILVFTYSLGFFVIYQAQVRAFRVLLGN